MPDGDNACNVINNISLGVHYDHRLTYQAGHAKRLIKQLLHGSGGVGTGASDSSALLSVAGFSAPAVPLLLQGYWLLLLQWALIAAIVAACWYPDAALRICTFFVACMQSLIKGAREAPRLIFWY